MMSLLVLLATCVYGYGGMWGMTLEEERKALEEQRRTLEREKKENDLKKNLRGGWRMRIAVWNSSRSFLI